MKNKGDLKNEDYFKTILSLIESQPIKVVVVVFLVVGVVFVVVLVFAGCCCFLFPKLK